ncbi:MAG TPA: hypothetical protein VL132_04670 [Planctomycetaceae bacterium]|nr:hypothetical protein [Planctomycetaceae bacterium]
MNELQRPPEVQAVLDEHLDAVERVLLNAGLSRTERQAICDAIQTQAADMLESRGIVAPTIEDVRTIVAAMDPPSSYRESAAPASKPAEPTRLHPAALWSVILPVAAFLLMFLPFGPRGEGAGLTFLATAALIAIALGVASIVAVRSRPRCWRGVGLAAIGICLLPSICLGTLAVYQWGPALHWSLIRDANYRDQKLHERQSIVAVQETVTSLLESRLQSGLSRTEGEELQQQLAEVREQTSKMEAHFAANPLPTLTEWDQWLIRNRAIIEAISNTVALLPAVGLSLLAPWLIYRQCRPSMMLRSDVQD